MKFKAEMGHWSSVVGNSVHLIGEDGRFLGQIAIMCQDDRLREKDVQSELCEKICAALNADLCASGQQVRALADENSRLNDAMLVLGAYLMEKGEAFRVGEGAELLDAYHAALTPAPQAATPTAQEAVPACFACEDNPKPPNIPCAVCGAHPPQPSETVAQEPVAWVLFDVEGVVCAITTKIADHDAANWTPLYAAPLPACQQEALVEAMRELTKQGRKTWKLGAQTGPHWVHLGAAVSKAERIIAALRALKGGE